MIRVLTLCVAFAVCGMLGSTIAVAADPVRIGVLGMDNYQAVEYVAMFNNPKAEGDFTGLRVTAAYPVLSPDYPKSAELTEMWKAQMLNINKNPADPATAIPQVEIVNSIEELLKRCDAVMIFSLDARMHLAQATAVLKAGKPLYIGRPLATTPEDAVAIFKVAEEAKVPCWSCSQHRFSPGFSGMREHEEVGKVLGCDVYGGYDVKAPEADKSTRGLHSIETLYTIMGPGVVKVSCASTPTADVVTAVWADGRVGTFRGVKEGAVKYSATVFGDKGVSTSGIYGHGIPIKGIVPTNDTYMGYRGLGAQMARFFKSGTVPVTPAETLEIHAFLAAADASRAQNGAVVPLQKLTTAK